jgi:hypothetical protein
VALSDRQRLPRLWNGALQLTGERRRWCTARIGARPLGTGSAPLLYRRDWQHKSGHPGMSFTCQRPPCGTQGLPGLLHSPLA